MIKVRTDKLDPVSQAFVAKNHMTLPQSRHRSNMRFKQAGFMGEKRIFDSIGGRFNMPSSMYHENVKAIKTILKFQEMYNGLNDTIKTGKMKTYEEFNTYLVNNPQIGFSQCIAQSSSILLQPQLNKKKMREEWVKIFNEPLSNITSTKAAALEYERIVAPANLTRRKLDQIQAIIRQNEKETTTVELPKDTNTNGESINRGMRSKVHDGTHITGINEWPHDISTDKKKDERGWLKCGMLRLFF